MPHTPRSTAREHRSHSSRFGIGPAFCRAMLAVAMLACSTAVPAQMVSRMHVTLGKTTVALDAAGYQRGNPSADVWVVEFADFGCSYCEKFFRETQPVFDSLYISKGRVFWKFVPFTIGMFPNSTEAAETSICAAQQGKFFPMHDVLYSNRKTWMKSSSVRQLMAQYATQVKLDPARYRACIAGKEARAQLQRNNALAKSLLIRGTPTFFINGEVIPGALPTDVFVKGMDAVLKERAGRGAAR
ncbi:MAG: thioredoxin domain-containing protein [Gemmatimonadaceae bacterium]|nr:thioredoxin domain-containing protein [Gemmatimonadaceae bacterium]